MLCLIWHAGPSEHQHYTLSSCSSISETLQQWLVGVCHLQSSCVYCTETRKQDSFWARVPWVPWGKEVKIYRVKSPDRNYGAGALDACSILVPHLFSCQDLVRIFKAGWKSPQLLWGCLPGEVNLVMSVPLTLPMTGLGMGMWCISGQWGMRGKSGISGKVFFTLQNAPLFLVWILGLVVWKIECLELLQPLCNHEGQVRQKQTQSGKVAGQWECRFGWITYPWEWTNSDFLLYEKRHFPFPGVSGHSYTGHGNSISLSIIYSLKQHSVRTHHVGLLCLVLMEYESEWLDSCPKRWHHPKGV